MTLDIVTVLKCLFLPSIVRKLTNNVLGVACVAQFYGDEIWYRGVIISERDSGNHCQVYFLMAGLCVMFCLT